MADFQYEIVEELGVLSTSAKGWTKELNKISWNGGAPKYDIRDWAPEHEKMGKGVTLTEEEMEALKELLKQELRMVGNYPVVTLCGSTRFKKEFFATQKKLTL